MHIALKETGYMKNANCLKQSLCNLIIKEYAFETYFVQKTQYNPVPKHSIVKYIITVTLVIDHTSPS